MATKLYPIGRNAFALGDIDWVNDDIRVLLIDADDYTYSDAHDFLDDIPGAARVASGAASVANKSASGGTVDGDDYTFSTVSGDPSEALIIYKHTGTESTSQLIAYIDNATGLPVTPNGGDITVQWDSGTDKIFTL